MPEITKYGTDTYRWWHAGAQAETAARDAAAARTTLTRKDRP
ncbi:hypothetical protein [Sphaerisporangium sp. NPDC051011]